MSVTHSNNYINNFIDSVMDYNNQYIFPTNNINNLYINIPSENYGYGVNNDADLYDEDDSVNNSVDNSVDDYDDMPELISDAYECSCCNAQIP